MSATKIQTPCPYCGREINGTWFSPCPSDDCPSLDAALAKAQAQAMMPKGAR